MNIGDLLIHLTAIEKHSRAVRECYTDHVFAQAASNRPTLVLAGGDLNGHVNRLAVPSAAAEAAQAAQQFQAMGQAHLNALANLCEGLLKELSKAGSESSQSEG